MSKRATLYGVPAFDLGGRDLDVEVRDMPDEVRSAALPALGAALRCLPSWAREVALEWDETDNEHEARIAADHVYRRATITVCPAFLCFGARARVRVMLHEIVHLHLDEMHVAALEALHTVTEEGSEVRAIAEKTIERALESATENLAHLIQDIAARPKRPAVRFTA